MMDFNIKILRENSLINKKQFYFSKVRKCKKYLGDLLIFHGLKIKDTK